MPEFKDMAFPFPLVQVGQQVTFLHEKKVYAADKRITVQRGGNSRYMYVIRGQIIGTTGKYTWVCDWISDDGTGGGGPMDRVEIYMETEERSQQGNECKTMPTSDLVKRGTGWVLRKSRGSWNIVGDGDSMGTEGFVHEHAESFPSDPLTYAELSSYVLGILRKRRLLKKNNPAPSFLQFWDKSVVKHTLCVPIKSKRQKPSIVEIDPGDPKAELIVH